MTNSTVWYYNKYESKIAVFFKKNYLNSTYSPICLKNMAFVVKINQ